MNLHRRLRFLPALALMSLAGAATAYGQTGVLGLVIDETRVREGATEASVVVRATAARNLAAGAIAIEMQDKDGLPGSPYTALLGVEVLSGAGDAVANATFDPLTLRTELTFSSASGTVNSAFGPLVIVRYALDPALELDRRFILRVDPDALDLDAADGQPVPYFTEKGRLRVDDFDADVESRGGGRPRGAGRDGGDRRRHRDPGRDRFRARSRSSSSPGSQTVRRRPRSTRPTARR